MGSLKLNYWYKLAIYLGAVLIVLTYIFPNNPNVGQYITFGERSLVLGLIVWIIDDTLYMGGHASEDVDRIKIIAAALWIVRWIGVLIWIAIIVTTF